MRIAPIAPLPNWPGAKHVTRPLGATRISDGQGSVDTMPRSCTCTEYSFPAVIARNRNRHARHVVAHVKRFLCSAAACIAQSLAVFSCTSAVCTGKRPQSASAAARHFHQFLLNGIELPSPAQWTPPPAPGFLLHPVAAITIVIGRREHCTLFMIAPL